MRIVFLLLTLFIVEIVGTDNVQKLPCVLYILDIDYEDGVDEQIWVCEVYGEDAQSAGAPEGATLARVFIEGIDLVLEANPNAQSGSTTLFASGALLDDLTLIITPENQLSFGQVSSSASSPPTGRRQLQSKSSGIISVLAVRITTLDASLTTTAAEISNYVFGTNGDLVNLKSVGEGCAAGALTINPATNPPNTCVDNPDFISAGRDDNNLDKDCQWFGLRIEHCELYGDDVCGTTLLTANDACCVCGGGDRSPIVNGVIDLRLNVKSNGTMTSSVEKEALLVLEEIFSTDDLRSVFDNIMLFIPFGTDLGTRDGVNWIGVGVVGGYTSSYNGDRTVPATSLHLHEVAHNWGLTHASEGRAEYGDGTGVMGETTIVKEDQIEGNSYCFNGAHSWQLGWYDIWNDSMDAMTDSYLGKLAGVQKLPFDINCDEIVVLKLSNFSPKPNDPAKSTDLYIIFNHDEGVNAGTQEARDQVTITSKKDDEDALTRLEAKLGSDSYAEFFIQGGPNLIIWVPRIIQKDPMGYAEIVVYRGSINDRYDYCWNRHSVPRKAPRCLVPTNSTTEGPTGGPTTGPTSSPTFEPTSGPTSAPTSGPASGPTFCPSSSDPIFVWPLLNNDLTSTPTSSPTSRPTQQSETNGDPHFKTWKKDHFEFHGQCDIVMISDKNFANGLGIDIHIRTKIVRYWSYIQRAVIRIGNDILEVEGLSDFSASYWINYEHMGEMTDLAGFPVSLNENTDQYTIDLSSLYPGEKIVIKTFKEFVGVKVVGSSEASFGKSVGIIGDFVTGKTYARDGSTVLNDFTELGLEWQVVPSDGLYFHEAARPQFPELCYLPEDPHGARARRLGESTITEEEAESVCASLKTEFSRKGCVYDILATQDMDMVGAY